MRSRSKNGTGARAAKIASLVAALRREPDGPGRDRIEAKLSTAFGRLRNLRLKS